MTHPLADVTATLSRSSECINAYRCVRELLEYNAPGGVPEVLGSLATRCAALTPLTGTTYKRMWDLEKIATYCHAWLELLGVDAPWKAMRDEYDRAKIKHGDKTLDSLTMDEDLKYFAIMEEVGEVARALTYDREHAGELVDEIIQTGALALAWYAACRKISAGVTE